MNLTSTQIKDTYGNLVTIGTVAGTPTTGTLQNGAGSDLTSITLNGGAVFNEGGGNFDFRVEGDTVTDLLFVDASADKVGIGTSSPATRLDVQAVSGAVFRASVSSDLSNIAVISGATKGVRIGANTTGGFMEGVDNTGVASFQPLTLGGSDIRFSISGVSLEKMRISSAGNVGIGTTTPASLLDVAGDLTIADKIIHSGDTNTAIRFPAADTVTVETAGSERLRITSAGNVKIGGTANRATTEGSAQLVLFNGTAPVGTLADGVSFYSASGEANVMDAAGNATLLSPHDKDTNEWIFRSKHTPTGKVLKIDVERMLRFINDHFGLEMIEEFTEA